MRYVDEQTIKDNAEKIDNLMRKIVNQTNKAAEAEGTERYDTLLRWIRCDLIQLSAYWREGFESEKIKKFLMEYFGVDEQTALEKLRALAR